jgi:hypothetical protein
MVVFPIVPLTFLAAIQDFFASGTAKHLVTGLLTVFTDKLVFVGTHDGDFG